MAPPIINGDGWDGSDQLMYPYEPSDYLTTINSMKQMHDQPLPFRLPFSGFAFTYIWVHKDGYVTFNKGLKSYSFPVEFPMVPDDTNLEEDPSIIAAFFAHQDIPSEVEGSGVYYRLIEMDKETNQSIKQRLQSDFGQAMAASVGWQPKFVFIITWKNMTFPNRRRERELKTNTYQMVLATDEMQTFVMFNYEWISWITHLDNYAGLNGPPAFIGFNGGNSTQSYEYQPFSQNPRLTLMPKMGWGNGLPGRYYFTIDEELEPGACVNKELDPNLPDRLGLHTSTDYILMLGGQELNFTGPCLTPDSLITCRFDIFKVRGRMMTQNIGSCITPPIMYEGYVDFTVTVDDKTFWYSRMYVQSSEARKEYDVWVREEDIVEKLPIDRTANGAAAATGGADNPHILTIGWNSDDLTWLDNAQVSVSIWGYRELSDVYPQLTYLVELAQGADNNGQLELDLANLPKLVPGQFDNYEFTFGYLAVNVTGDQWSQTLWSKPMPLGWFMRPYWIREYGHNWSGRFCSKWFDREQELDRFALTVFRCPCTIVQSERDRGRFAPDLQCNVIDKKCDTQHHGAQHCVRTARPSVGGSGQTCCYDDYGELVQTADTMFGGRPSRAFVYGKHPFKMAVMVPTLSYWLYDIMPFFYCCKWSASGKGDDNSDTCQMFNYWRTSQDCSSYQPPGVANVYGDPHIVTFDRFNYTFNGKGEFVLINTDTPVHKLDIHGRFEQLPNLDGTHLTAVAIRDNISAIVELRLRPVAARWQFQLYLFADKEMYYFWQPDMRSIQLRGVQLYQPAGIRNMSHVIAMFDSGAGVEIMVTPVGSLMLNVYLPQTFINSTRGLLGKWTRDPLDDLELPDGSHGPSAQPGLTSRDLYLNFANHYRLKETKSPYLGQSLFWHNPVPHSHYDDLKFEPKFEISQQDLDGLPDADKVCSDSQACLYDLVVTQDTGYAQQTKRDEASAELIHRELSDQIIRCPALPRPRNGRKSENRYWPGTIVRFSCDDGYRLVGYEVRRCREDGLWSWGVDPECIRDLKYKLTLAGIFTGVILPVIVLIALFVVCWRRGRKSVANNYYMTQPLIKDRVVEDRDQLAVNNNESHDEEVVGVDNKTNSNSNDKHIAIDAKQAIV
ncbi:protein mesh-like [Oppia nitens]|uniref:protein mesh-like n=1 Tax=Oppia nitens TaxID=1686743 RepID=UPI0023D9A5A7|nr:protein mesh-like [Oppia nitens]